MKRERDADGEAVAEPKSNPTDVCDAPPCSSKPPLAAAAVGDAGDARPGAAEAEANGDGDRANNRGLDPTSAGAIDKGLEMLASPFSGLEAGVDGRNVDAGAGDPRMSCILRLGGGDTSFPDRMSRSPSVVRQNEPGKCIFGSIARSICSAETKRGIIVDHNST